MVSIDLERGGLQVPKEVTWRSLKTKYISLGVVEYIRVPRYTYEGGRTSVKICI